MARTNNLTDVDFDSLKANLKTYLSSQDQFQDYDFDASNMGVLIDLLAFVTQMNGFYTNMVGNEMFLDSAVLRDSIVSHAKELNYLPRSFRSSYANVNIKITASSSDTTALTIPKGTSFTSRSGSQNFTFVTDAAISMTSSNSTFWANNVLIHEGDYISDAFVYDSTLTRRYVLKNQTVDTNSITVTVIEDNGATTHTYTQATSLFGLSSTSKVFFVQAAENEQYEIVFGDGVVGRRPDDGAVVVAEYRAGSGELPNGLRAFTSDGAIGGESDVTVTVNEAAQGGAVSESTESIRFNAPRAFTRQERAVTADDYETLLLANYSEINDVVAYGGEEASPPKWGRVIISVDLGTSDTLPPSNKDKYYSFLKTRTPLSIDPVFVEPQYTYLGVTSTVRYDINQTSLSASDIENLVVSAISNFNDVNLDGFKKTLRESKLVAAIDAAQDSVISNDTEVTMIKRIEPTLGVVQNIDVDFGVPMRDDVPQLDTTHAIDELNIVYSDEFTYRGMTCIFEDDGDGTLRVMTLSNGNYVMLEEIGTVDYSRGTVQIQSWAPESFSGNYLKLYARPADKDVASSRNTILSIVSEDISVTVEQLRT